MNGENIYRQHGFNSRHEYLESLADEYGVSLETVYTCAELMGESEDFDGLISMLQDAAVMGL